MKATEHAPPLPDGYLDKTQVGQLTQLNIRTIDRLMLRGLPHYKIGSRRVRFKKSEVEEFMKKQFRVSRLSPAVGKVCP